MSRLLDKFKYIGSTRQTSDLDGFGIFLVLQHISLFSIVMQYMQQQFTVNQFQYYLLISSSHSA